MRCLFVSDLHLSPRQPATRRRFEDFLAHAAHGCEALYILGDLFDYWVGDDSLAEPFNAGIAQALAEFARQSPRLNILNGNRDFLLGEGFAAASAARLLAPETVVDVCGTPTLLLHGDELSTDDAKYQAFRAKVRAPGWQAKFLAKPLAERRALVESLRQSSEEQKQHKSDAYMDATPAAVHALLRRHGYPRIVHGHTHRAACHRHELDGHVCERWVLPSWDDAPGYLECTPDGCRLRALP